ncbi:BTAD domain-containing putative transcriptional regulator [Nocardioides sp. GCM10027113]|uniref:BTAD domain-containing putative transcriptional regulator n=1 Tax=unclassified Nocardioides TaxID=2615069 RepID=UPI00360937AA
MLVSVLGATEVWRDGLRVNLGTRKRRALVAALALAHGRPVSVDALIDLLWADAPPDGVAGTLQVYVSGLRRVLEPARAPRAPAELLVTVAPGYALRVPDDTLDAASFDRTVSEVHRALGRGAALWEPPPLPADALAGLVSRLDAALALWRGEPYVELGDAPAAVAERARLEELRSVALEDRAYAALALGDHGTVAAELEALTAAYPLRERLWGLRALALARAGRQADALETLREVREVLDTELGLEPSVELRDLQTALLRQEPSVLRPVAPALAGGSPPMPALDLPAPPAPPPPADRAAPLLPSWPMVGRDDQLAALVAALDRAESGAPAFAAVTGEPGIGKSRLCAELAAVAVPRGARLLVGRCSQDDGAPPLWPWQQVLRCLGADLEVADGEDEGAEFRVWESVVAQVAAAARDETLVLVLDDLHWADGPSLRVLRLMAETVQAGRLLVVGTWRPNPEPCASLGDAAEALARRHAVRLELVGLEPPEVATVVEAVAEVSPSQAQADLLARRTDGNPFFLVEFARLAHDGGDLDGLVAGADPPTAVSDVLDRRLSLLPDETRSVLRWAAVIGRGFELAVLAEVAGLDEDALLDLLDPALDAGLVREDDIGSYWFGHALVRDQIYGAFSPTRRARAHARVAEVLEQCPDRESETARHWLAAGPARAGRAWRAAREAATVARRLHAHTAASVLLDEALERLAIDPEATPRDRYDLLMDLGEAHRWRGSWSELLEVVERAVATADEIGDVRLLARAASAMTIGALWQSASHGQVHEGVVAALRRALADLPPDDDPLRCRAMLALANELYYGSTAAERAALVDEAVAMARRLGDQSLALDACQVGFIAQWRPDNASMRLALAEQAVRLARDIGNERAFVVASNLQTVALSELGEVDRMWAAGAVAREESERLHIPYGLIVQDVLQLPWLAMAGRFRECEELLGSISRLVGQMTLQGGDDAVASATLSMALWDGRAGEMAPMLTSLEDGPIPITSMVLTYLLRAGQVDEARAHAAAHQVDLSAVDWFSMLNWACAAEAALGLGDPDLGAGSYALLAPFEGRVASAGSGNAMGPVDAYLAQAAAAVGDRELATRHADTAAALMEAWRIPVAAAWFRGLREQHGF